MHQHLTYAKSMGVVHCHLPTGERVDLPSIPGILKHPSPEALPELLSRPEVARKYTLLALSKCAWPILRQFPRQWLVMNLESAPMSEGRRRALRFLLTP